MSGAILGDDEIFSGVPYSLNYSTSINAEQTTKSLDERTNHANGAPFHHHPRNPTVAQRGVGSANEDKATASSQSVFRPCDHHAASSLPIDGIVVRVWRVVQRFVPITVWLPPYAELLRLSPEGRAQWQRDVIVGLTVGAMCIPQALAYGELAGLPEVYGLYSCIVPAAVYACLGTSPHLSVGPTAVLSILSKEVAAEFADEDTDEFINYSLTMAMVTGMMMVFMSVFNIGRVVNFLSHSVIIGFSTAAAIIIGVSQVEKLFGFDIDDDPVYLQIYHLLRDIGQTEGITLGLSIAYIIGLVGLRKFSRKYKKYSLLGSLGPLILVVISTFLTFIFRLDKEGVDIVGDIEKGVPATSEIKFSEIPDLFLPCLVLVIVSYVESVSIASSLAMKNDYEIRPNQELLALGFSNFFASFFSAYNATGSFSRSAVTEASGAVTQVAQIVVVFVVICVLEFMTTLCFYLPKNALAAIVVVSVSQLVAYDEFLHMYHKSRKEFYIMGISFISTIVIGAEYGLILAMVVSLCVELWFYSQPTIQIVDSQYDGSGANPIQTEPSSKENGNWMVLRLHGPMYFGSKEHLVGELKRLFSKPALSPRVIEGSQTVFDPEEATITEICLRNPTSSPWFIIFDMSHVVSLDVDGLQIIERLHRMCKSNGMRLILAGFNTEHFELYQRVAIPSLVDVHVAQSVGRAIQELFESGSTVSAQVNQ